MKPPDQARWQGSVNSWLAQGWATAGLLATPNANTIWCDTGQLVAGWYDFTILLSAALDYTPLVALQHRNAANNANIGVHFFANIAFVNYIFNINNYRMATNERIRVLNTVDFNNACYGSIIYTKRA